MTTQQENAIVNLYRDGFPHFARMVRRMGGTLEQAKDSFHDALLIYLEKQEAGKLNIHSSPKAYLLGTAKICWLQMRDKESIVPLPEGVAEETGDTNMGDREKSLLDSLLRSGKK